MSRETAKALDDWKRKTKIAKMRLEITESLVRAWQGCVPISISDALVMELEALIEHAAKTEWEGTPLQRVDVRFERHYQTCIVKRTDGLEKIFFPGVSS